MLTSWCLLAYWYWNSQTTYLGKSDFLGEQGKITKCICISNRLILPFIQNLRVCLGKIWSNMKQPYIQAGNISFLMPWKRNHLPFNSCILLTNSFTLYENLVKYSWIFTLRHRSHRRSWLREFLTIKWLLVSWSDLSSFPHSSHWSESLVLKRTKKCTVVDWFATQVPS